MVSGVNSFEQALSRYLGAGQLRKIRQTKIGIAGAGGLGSNCAMMLVRCGFRKFTIIDFDDIEDSNLNRQFYFANQIGQPKVNALRENLTAINEALDLTVIKVKIDASQAKQAFADCDIIVEAFDKPEEKRMLVDAYVNSGKLLVAASGIAGWGCSDFIKAHKLGPKFFVVGDLKSGINRLKPPLSPQVTMAAAIQADIILTYVLGSGKGEQADEAARNTAAVD